MIPSRIARSNNTTIWVPDFNRDYYMDMLLQRRAGRQLDAQLLHRAVVRPLHGRTAT